MSNIERIIDIFKKSMCFNSEEIDKLFEGDEGKHHGKIETSINFFNQENNEKFTSAELQFHLLITPEEYEGKISEFNNVKGGYAKLDFTYIIVFESVVNIEEKEVLYHLEPYIRKELLGFCQELSIPNIPLPIRFWEHDKSK